MKGGTKFDGDKPRTDLLPIEPMLGAAQGFAYGAGKYGEHNWRKGIALHRLYGALLRHLFAFWNGEDVDAVEDGGSGLLHLDHAMCCLMMLHTTYLTRPDLDDRGRVDTILPTHAVDPGPRSDRGDAMLGWGPEKAPDGPLG